MVKINIVNNILKINILGVHKLLSLKSSIIIPLSNIISVKHNTGSDLITHPKGIRMLGVNLFPFLVSGAYRGFGNEFWDVRNWEKSIVIETKDKYKRIIVEVENPLKTIGLIDKAIQERSKSLTNGTP